MGFYVAVGGGLLVYLVLCWFLGTWLHLTGSSLWVLRGGLAFIGVAASATLVWWHHSQESGGAESVGEGADPELDVLIRDASNRLRASKLGRGGSLGNQPLIFVIGDQGTTKTTTIVHSGLEAELLSGHVFQDNVILPTRAANFWYTRQGVLLDVGAPVLSQPDRWMRLVKRMRPGQLASAVRKGQQAPRGIVVCFDIENFFKAGASEAIPMSARNLNARLQEVSQVLGIALPVYVLFTKIDRVPSFADYVRNLMKGEASQVLGSTLPLKAHAGVYAEEETRRLSAAFDELFYSLAEKRMTLLAREADPNNLGGGYEFPRDLRKLRTLLVQFLVDLGRPSQLRTNPFLRGFYFSGVRAVFVEDVAPVADVSVPVDAGPAGATRILNMAQIRAAQAPAVAPMRGTRKVPEWTFLTHLFSEVIFKDQPAMGLSTSSTKVHTLQRILLGATSAILLILAICFTVSFVRNRSLESDVTQAATAASGVQVSAGQMVSADDLRKLDNLRLQLVKLEDYEKNGAPFSMRWGLYSGDRIYRPARTVYFSSFQRMLLAPTQSNLLATMRKLPDAPAPTDDYGTTYDTLKAYLITTSNHEKSTPEFLSPVLVNRWAAGQQIEDERADLAKKQFDYYAVHLVVENPFSSDADDGAVNRARGYLAKFGGIERMYRFMIDQANGKFPAINFNKKFPGSAEVVVDSKTVDGAFTKSGWAFVQDAIAHADQFFAGEEWVLGPQVSAGIDKAAIVNQLRTRYLGDFIDQWRTFLRSAFVQRYAGPRDAAKKLGILAGNQSPLLALFWVVSDNTGVGSPDVTTAFQPVQAMVPPGGPGDRYISPTNAPYMNGLVGLQTAMEQVASSPTGVNDTNAVSQGRSAAMQARQTMLQIAQGFTIDSVGKVDATTKKLMEDPIKYAEGVITAMGPAEMNGKGKALCAAMRDLFSKYPFNPAATQRATVQQMDAVFQPGLGAVPAFYDSTLKNFLQRQGSDFVPNPTAGINFNPAFLTFFSRAMRFTDTVYPGGSTQPRLTFTMRPYPTEGIKSLNLTIGGQSMVSPGSPKQFIWTGSDIDQVRLDGNVGGSSLTFLTYSGPWAVFEFFNNAERMQTNGNVQSVEWIPKTSGQPFMINGKPLTVHYDVDISGAPVFQKGYFSTLRCVPDVAR